MKCCEANPNVLAWSEFSDDKELREKIIKKDPRTLLTMPRNNDIKEWILAVNLDPGVLFERSWGVGVPNEIYFHSKPVWEAAVKKQPSLILDTEKVPDIWRTDLDLVLIAAEIDDSVLDSPNLHPDIKKALDDLENKYGKIDDRKKKE